MSLIYNQYLILFIPIVILIGEGKKSCVKQWYHDAKLELLSYNSSDFTRYITLKVGEAGNNLTLSCLTGGIIPTTSLYELENYYKWIYQPYNQTMRENNIWKDLILDPMITTTIDGSRYTVGDCFEINFHNLSFSGDVDGKFACVLKDNQTKIANKSMVEIVVNIDIYYNTMSYSKVRMPIILDKLGSSACLDVNKGPDDDDERFPIKYICNGTNELSLLHSYIHPYGIVPKHRNYNTITTVPLQINWGGCEPCDSLNGTRLVEYKKLSKVTNIMYLRTVHYFLQKIITIKGFIPGCISSLPLYLQNNYANCQARNSCIPDRCMVNMGSISVDIKLKPGDLAKRIRKQKLRTRLKLRPEQFKNVQTIYGDEAFPIELVCLPDQSVSKSDDDLLWEDNSVSWYQCIDRCVKISGITFLRFNVDRQTDSLKIKKLILKDSAVYVCTQYQQVRSAIRLKVFPSTEVFDIRTPVGSMFFATILFIIIYLTIFLSRIGVLSWLFVFCKRKKLEQRGYKQIGKAKVPKIK